MKRTSFWLSAILKKLYPNQLATEKDKSYTRVPLSEFLKQWQDQGFNRAIKGEEIKEVITRLQTEMSDKKMGASAHYDELIAEAEDLLKNDQKELDLIRENFAVYVSQAIDNLPEAENKKVDDLKAKLSNIIDKIKHTDIEIKRLLRAYGDKSLKDIPKAIVSKIAYRFLRILYVGICVFLNQPLFQEVVNDIPLAGLILSFGLSMIEMVLAQLIGSSIALGKKRRALFGFISGLGLIVFILTQGDLLPSLLIIALFLIGTLLSYIYKADLEKRRVPELIEELRDNLQELNGEKIRTENLLPRTEEALKIKAEGIVAKRADRLESLIQTNSRRLEKLHIEKEAELQHLENVEIEASDAVRQGFAEYNTPAA